MVGVGEPVVATGLRIGPSATAGTPVAAATFSFWDPGRAKREEEEREEDGERGGEEREEDGKRRGGT